MPLDIDKQKIWESKNRKNKEFKIIYVETSTGICVRSISLATNLIM